MYCISIYLYISFSSFDMKIMFELISENKIKKNLFIYFLFYDLSESYATRTER